MLHACYCHLFIKSRMSHLILCILLDHLNDHLMVIIDNNNKRDMSTCFDWKINFLTGNYKKKSKNTQKEIQSMNWPTILIKISNWKQRVCIFISSKLNYSLLLSHTSVNNWLSIHVLNNLRIACYGHPSLRWN